MSRPFSSRSFSPPAPFTRVNGKIRARDVRVIDGDQKNLGVSSLGEAINLARSKKVDLVEVNPAAVPPVCRLVDFGKFCYEQAKREIGFKFKLWQRLCTPILGAFFGGAVVSTAAVGVPPTDSPSETDHSLGESASTSLRIRVIHGPTFHRFFSQ